MKEPSEPTPVPLSERHCVPCQGDTPPLKGEALLPLLSRLDGWQVVEEHHLVKQYDCKDFAEALAFVNLVGAIAEAEFHHPDLQLAWGRVEVMIWTHKIDGLTESDFVFAAKCDRAYTQ